MSVLRKISDKHDIIYKVVLFLISIFTIVYFFPQEASFKYDFQKNQPWHYEDLYAPYDIPIYMSESDIEEEQQQIKENKKLYFNYDNQKLNIKLKLFYRLLDEAWPDFYEENVSSWDFLKSDAAIKKYSNNIKKKYEKAGERLIKQIYIKGVIELNSEMEKFTPETKFFVDRNGIHGAHTLEDFFTQKTAYEFWRTELEQITDLEHSFLSGILDKVFKKNAINVYYNDKTTSNALEAELKRIETVIDNISEKSIIIRKGDVIDDVKYQRLKSFQKRHQSQSLSKSKKYAITIGQTVLVTILIACFAFYLIFFRPQILEQNKNLVFLLLTITSVVVLTSLTIQHEFLNVFVVPLCVAPIVVRSFFDSRTAFFVHLVIILLIGFNMPNGFHFIFMQSVAGMMGIYGFANFKNRSQLFLTTLAILIAYSLTYTALNVIIEGDFNKIDWLTFGWIAISAALTLLAYPMIYIFEKLFGYISDVTLLELADTNNKLLRELARKAPGTFQHSLQVANLAEAAIQKIGGNALLIRTAAMYHDIGKMESPMYFIENQSTGVNPHDELSYEESAQIIIGHVINGIEIARKAGLPDMIIDFIRTHHGTTKTGYFYRLYMQENPEDENAEEMFTYPGPIPYSKETAVLMMADSVEAASRSIKEPDAEKISNLVDGIINSQVKEEQFANANITLKDITLIKKMFTKMLMNIYHVRIEYPH